MMGTDEFVPRASAPVLNAKSPDPSCPMKELLLSAEFVKLMYDALPDEEDVIRGTVTPELEIVRIFPGVAVPIPTFPVE
jgi:hypothetical protein